MLRPAAAMLLKNRTSGGCSNRVKLARVITAEAMSESSAALPSGPPVHSFFKSSIISFSTSLRVAFAASVFRYSRMELNSARSSQIPWQTGHQSMATDDFPKVTDTSLPCDLGQARSLERAVVFSRLSISSLSQCKRPSNALFLSLRNSSLNSHMPPQRGHPSKCAEKSE